MSSAEKTLTKVSSEFLTEISSELNNTRSEFVKIIEQVELETISSYNKILESAKKEGDSIKRQIIGSAEINARNSQLKAFEEFIVDVLNTGLTNIKSIDKERYEEAISRIISEACDVVGKESIVYCNDEDLKIVEKVIKKLKLGNMKISPKRINTVGGVIVESKDSTVRYDNTIEARLERAKQMLRKEISMLVKQ